MKYTVEFENTKNRGDIEQKVTFQFYKIKGKDYQALFDSVRRLSDMDRENARQQSDRDRRKKADKPIIDCIRNIIGTENCGKMELIKRVIAETAEPRRKIITAINYWTGEGSEGGIWHVDKQDKDKNKHVYKMNPPVLTIV